MSAMYDVCIVGAGVSGASLAAHLSGKNLRIALMDICFDERDRIVGELMQPGGVYMLQQLGLDHVLDQIESCQVDGYALFNKDKSVLLNYGCEGEFKELKGRGLNNGKFIQALRALSEQSSNVDRIVGQALDFIEEENNIEGVVYSDHNQESKSVLAKLTIVCDGFFSVLRSKLVEEKKEVTSHFVGMVLENCQLPHENYGHIFMGGKAPFLCYRISKTEVRLLVDFPGNEAVLKGVELDNYLINSVLPYLPESMHQSLLHAIEVAKYKHMPNHYMAPVSCKKTGVAMVGDSLNMRHPLTGGGMTAALTDVTLLCKAIIENEILLEESKLKVAISKYYEERNAWNSSINILADALYKVTLNEELKEACFNYLAKGASYYKQPIDLLSGISRDNTLLFKHFIQVALLGAKESFFKEIGLKSIDNSYVMLKDASQIIFPLVMKEKLFTKELITSKMLNQLAGV